MTANQRGIALMVLSMAGFSVEDAFIKAAARIVPIGQVVLLTGLALALVFALLCRLRGHAILSRAAFSRPLLTRSAGELAGTLGVVMALATVPLSAFSAILMATPLVVTALAGLILGEPVGWRRWAAVLTGFAGVMLVLAPGAIDFDPHLLWCVLAVFGLAVRDLVTRLTPVQVPTFVVATWGNATVALLGAGIIAAQGRLAPVPALTGSQIAGAVTIGTFAYWAIVEAMRAGEVSVVAPFRYSRIVFGLALGVLIFGERLGAQALAGTALIIAAGLYALYRERVRAVEARAAVTANTLGETRP